MSALAQMSGESQMAFDSQMTSNAVGTFVFESQHTGTSNMTGNANRKIGFLSSFTATSTTTSAIRLYWENVPPISETWTDNMPFRR